MSPTCLPDCCSCHSAPSTPSCTELGSSIITILLLGRNSSISMNSKFHIHALCQFKWYSGQTRGWQWKLCTEGIFPRGLLTALWVTLDCHFIRWRHFSRFPLPPLPYPLNLFLPAGLDLVQPCAAVDILVPAYRAGELLGRFCYLYIVVCGEMS